MIRLLKKIMKMNILEKKYIKMLINVIRSPIETVLKPRSTNTNDPIITVDEASNMTKLCVKTIKDILSHNYTIVCKKETCTINQNE